MKRPTWTRPYWIIDHLPLPRMLRLRWLRSYIDVSYGRDLRRAERAKATADRLESIQHDWMFEVGFISEEEDQIFTRRQIRQARVLRLAVPIQADDWEETNISGHRVLSDVGTARLREKVREELRWRQERRAHWFAFLTAVATPLVGIVGAITGLIAVLQKSHGG